MFLFFAQLCCSIEDFAWDWARGLGQGTVDIGEAVDSGEAVDL